MRTSEAQEGHHTWWAYLCSFIALCASGALVYGSIAAIPAVNHASDTNRHRLGNFNVTRYGNTHVTSRDGSWYVGTLNLQQLDNPDYQCWLTTDVQNQDVVELGQSLNTAYPVGSALNRIWYNPDGSSCGFSQSNAVSANAILLIIALSGVSIGLVAIAITVPCCGRCSPCWKPVPAVGTSTATTIPGASEAELQTLPV